MTIRSIKILAYCSRTLSYVLVFYSGLAIGYGGANAGQSPIWSLFCALVFGAAASATLETRGDFKK